MDGFFLLYQKRYPSKPNLFFSLGPVFFLPSQEIFYFDNSPLFSILQFLFMGSFPSAFIPAQVSYFIKSCLVSLTPPNLSLPFMNIQ